MHSFLNISMTLVKAGNSKPTDRALHELNCAVLKLQLRNGYGSGTRTRLVRARVRVRVLGLGL